MKERLAAFLVANAPAAFCPRCLAESIEATVSVDQPSPDSSTISQALR